MTDAELLAKREQRKASYWRYRDQILARRRTRYAGDPEYRERIKRHSRDFYKPPHLVEIGKRLRKAQYWKDPERFRLETKQWISNNRELWLQRSAQRRAKNREVNRAHARMEASLCTDSYVRNQLSKYSTKSTDEWTQDEVQAKREMILENRARRITQEKANAIRLDYNSGKRTAQHLAEHYDISISNVFMILNNRTHHDPNYTVLRIVSPAGLSRVLKMMNSAGQLEKLWQCP